MQSDAKRCKAATSKALQTFLRELEGYPVFGFTSIFLPARNNALQSNLDGQNQRQSNRRRGQSAVNGFNLGEVGAVG